MKPWPLRIAVVLSALALLVMGASCGRRELSSAEQIRTAQNAGDAEKVYKLIRGRARKEVETR